MSSIVKSALAIQCLPQGVEGKQNVYRAVDKAIEAIEASGLPFTVGPFETVVEGPADRLFALAQAAHLAVLEAGAPGVATYMKLFSAPDLGSSEEKTGKYRAKGH
jgi:uncharacterized protein YqgV (UPF0045/DUF77 family)